MSERISLDKSWRFREMWDPFGGDGGGHPMGAEALTYDDSGWNCVDLPHDWAIESPMSPEPYVRGANDNAGQNAYLHGGIGWYRRHFTLDDIENKEFLLQIDGSYRKSEVWVNGNYIGGEENGYFSYALDMTDYVVCGDNLLVIRCDNLDTPNCRWYTGSGLYRHVWLVTREKTHFAHWGIAVTTPLVAEDRALVHVEADLEGPDGAAVVNAVIYDSDEREVASATVRSAILSGKGRAALDIPVDCPALWSIEKPSMYTLQMALGRGGNISDQETIPFGIRSIEFRKGVGFLLNGVPTKMKGICMHHDGGPLGAAVPENVWESRLRLLRKLGCNAIRTSHNPPAPEVLDLCDRMGFVVMDEFCDKWEPPHFIGFARNWKRSLTDWIHRDRNHPSVIMWSVGNENDLPGTDYLLSRYRLLCDEVRSLDASRPAMAAAEGGSYNPNTAVNHLKTRGITDFIGVNYTEPWYDRIFDIDPNVLILGTENLVYMTSTAASRNEKVEFCPWHFVEADDRVMGSFLWTGIDYLGESWHGWPGTGSYAGLVDITGVAKPVADLYQTLWKKDEPQVYIDIYRMPVAAIMEKVGLWGSPRQDRTWDGEGVMELSTYTNCEEVELLLNGESLGTKRMADAENRILRWEVDYEPGELTAVGKNDGVEAARYSLRTPGKPVGLKLVPTHQTLSANGWDTALIELTLVDENGTTCRFEGEASFEVTGEGTLAAVGNGGLRFHGPFQGPKAPAFNDRATAYLRAGTQKGVATLKAEAMGFTASVDITIE